MNPFENIHKADNVDNYVGWRKGKVTYVIQKSDKQIFRYVKRIGGRGSKMSLISYTYSYATEHRWSCRPRFEDVV